MSRGLKLIGDDAPWFSGGIRFSCTRSGKCCTAHGDYAYVFLTREDERRLAAHLSLPLRELRRRHTKRPAMEQRSLRFPGGKCTFLRDQQCSVYEARPRQCRTWPFWPENMPRSVWEEEIASFCPGVGKGRLYSAEEIQAVMDGRGEVG